MPRYPQLADREWLIERAPQGTASIATTLGCGRSAVVRALNRHGIPIRTPVVQPGDRYGRLLIIQVRPGSKCDCRCDCGNTLTVQTDNLRSGHTGSCGCLRQGRSYPRHGHSSPRSPEYSSWQSMIGRCTNPRNPKWAQYGGRDITICDRWRTFEHFLADMGPRPEGTTLDRHPDPTGNYEPGNCRWATSREQRHNRREQS